MPIYILQNNEQTGPFTSEELQQHLVAGNLSSDIPAWREGLTSWVTLRELLQETDEKIASKEAFLAHPEPAANTQTPPLTASSSQAPVTITITRVTLVRTGYGIGALLAIFLIYYFLSPFYAVHALRSAIKAGDADALETYVDFPTLRASLKEQMKAQVASDFSAPPTTTTVTDAQLGPVTITHQETHAPTYTDPLSQVAQALAPSMIDSEIDGAVTPSGSLQYLASFRGEAYPPGATNDLHTEREGFDSLTDFRFTFFDVRFHMRFSGLGWKVYRIDLADVIAAGNKVKSVFKTETGTLPTH